LLENFNELLMFSGSSRLKLDNKKLYTMLMKLVISLIFHSKINYNINC